jgi:hypothetical protein
MDYSNYRTINTTSNPEQYNWCLSTKIGKSFTRVGLKLNNGKMFNYACRFPIQEDDVAIVGKDVIYSYAQELSEAKTTGQFGEVVGVTKPFTGRKEHFAELDFVFTKEANKKTVSGCIDYLLLQGDKHTLQYDEDVSPIYPITFLTRKLLAASSVIAFSDLADANGVEKAIEYIRSEQVISESMLDTGWANLEPSDIDLEEIYVDDKGKNDNLGVDLYIDRFSKDREIDPKQYPVIKEYVNKYCFIGAVSIMVRGGFKNLLEAFLYAKPPIATFYNEMLELVCDEGNADCIEILKEYSEDKVEQYSVAAKVKKVLDNKETETQQGPKVLTDAEYKKVFTFKELDDGTLCINKYKGYEKHIAVPEQIDGKAITVIGDKAFRDKSNLLAVLVPNSIVSIGK